MRSLRIRQWMFIGMLMVLVIPRLFYEIPGLLDHYLFERALHSQQQADLNEAIKEVSKVDVSHWRETNWQNSLGKVASSSHVGIILLDASNQEVFHSVPSGSEKMAFRQMDFIEQGQLQGSALFFAPKPNSTLANLFAIFATACAILFIGWQIGRVVVKPLEAMSAAARRIASGELDFHLPDTTVREVADVRSAFQAMGSGLRESITRQSELEEARRFFISAIAHDFRTPLFTLRGFLSRLERGMTSNPEKASRYIAICSKKTEQIDRLVSDLFAYAKLESLEQAMRSEIVEFDVLLAEIIEDYRPTSKEKGIELEFDRPRESSIILGDPHLLRRALGNLIDNALRHTPRSGKISIHWRLEKTRMFFSIEDTGLGISEQALPHIFEAFYRSDDSRNPESGGTGLGLTIARRIIRAHNGDLTADNRSPLSGAIFTGWIALE
ncbi:HAMP domain-containing sensor histidine kinase [Cohnella sp. WQ 127256]|uniref:sensor histidine kinase n=1 Tax=Cohnella sp. WQ 127256 TaxID=2938790 RepID=UPI0021181971|nr:HAMP domain-containing sensor histidine kinase [Cohnella sp. WQ 127256]